jgi:hypothetical protein
MSEMMSEMSKMMSERMLKVKNGDVGNLSCSHHTHTTVAIVFGWWAVWFKLIVYS